MDVENKYGTLSMQRSLLPLLEAVHGFCISESIDYSIAYGTLLGAIRYQGFIPWDDDVDIVVDRANYNKLKERIAKSSTLVFEKGTKHSLWVDRIRLGSERDTVNGYYPTCDVFILDRVPNNDLKRMIKLFSIYAMQGAMKERLVFKGGLLMKCCSFLTFIIGKLFPFNTKYRWYHKISQWWTSNTSKKLACYNACFKDVACLFDSEILDSYVLIPFENIMVHRMKGYDNFLTSRYGDYMTPPDEKDRKASHIK